jgi:hypothetical protein
LVFDRRHNGSERKNWIAARGAIKDSQVAQSLNEMNIGQVELGAARIGTKVLEECASKSKLRLSMPTDSIKLAIGSVSCQRRRA